MPGLSIQKVLEYYAVKAEDRKPISLLKRGLTTMPDETPQARSLISEGQFQAALEHLQQHPLAGGPGYGSTERLLLAEVLERTGHLTEARIQIAALRKTPRLTESERARCMMVEGLISKQLGHLEESAQAFRKAYQIAEQIDSIDLRAWSQLRLLSVSADLDGRDLDADVLSVLRCNVEQAAVPAVSIAHQIFLAEYHAKRGDLDASRHHTDVARSLLRSFPNYWLRGLLDLHQSCLNYLEGRYLDSLDSARQALASCAESGHPLTGVIALADMAAAYLAVGQAARATTCLTVALRKPGKEEQVWGLLLETLAEAQLVSGDVEGCAVSLRTARELSARHSQLRSVWHRNWNLRTEARLLQRLGRWKESLELIRTAEPREHLQSRSFPRVQLGALEVLALARLNKRDHVRSAVGVYLHAGLEAPRSSHTVSLSGSHAMLAAAAGDRRALPLSIQALRVVGATGETSSLVEVVDQLLDLAGRPGSHDAATCANGGRDSVWRPTIIRCHLDAITSVLLEPHCKTEGLATLLCSLMDLATDPVSLGEETLRLLVSVGWIRSGAVLETCGPVVSPVITYAYPVTESTLSGSRVKRPEGTIRICLGSRQSRSYDLLISPADSAGALSGCHAVARLLLVIRQSRMSEQRTSTRVGEETIQPNTSDAEGLFRSPTMLTLLASARRVAPLGITVLLTGESGTGKEVIARSIHRASGDVHSRFIAFNCSTVPRDMVDSQLFGYRRGAFTGAVQEFKGVLHAADGGTLLLDEVGELPLDTQPKLLRFLDTGEVQALGEAAPRRVKVRIIAATNANLEALVAEGRFREDLFYRLNVVRFRLPPLRERREEVGPLIAMFLSRYASEFGKHNISLSEAAMEHLLLYPWPGNVRELSHEIRRLVALGESDSVVDVFDLDARIRGQSREPIEQPVHGVPTVTVRIDRPLEEIREEIERAAITYALECSEGRLDTVARRLGLSRKGLYLKRQRLGFL